MMCARLSVLCEANGNLEGTLYGGEGAFRVRPSSAANGAANSWKVRFMNTPGEHHFTITPVVNAAGPEHAQEAPAPCTLRQTGP